MLVIRRVRKNKTFALKTHLKKRTVLVLLVTVTALFLSMPEFSSHNSYQVHTPLPYLIQNSETGASPDAQIIGSANQSQLLSVMVSLQYRNQRQLNEYLDNLQSPSSPYFHRYLSVSQFANLYSPSAGEYYRYVEYFTARGFYVTTYEDRVSIGLSGSVGQFEDLFGATLGVYAGTHGKFYAPVSEISLPVYYGKISAVVGLSDQFKASISPLFEGSGSTQTLYGADFQAAYHLSELYKNYGYPINETIATILWSGTNSAGQSVGPYVPSNIQTYIRNNTPSNEPRAKILYYNFSKAPAPGPNAANDTTGANVESTLDIEMAASLAPGSSIVEVYGPEPTLAYLDQALANILNPSYNSTVNSALKNVSVISNSWGTSDMNNTLWSQYEAEAAARGITVFASSGDNGNTPSQYPSFPASSAFDGYGTVAVGGTFTTLSGSSSLNGSGTTAILTQSVWYNLPHQGNGTQGGVSENYSEPSWQINSPDASGVIASSSSITGLSTGRGTPDISADGANMTIYLSLAGTTGYYTVDGTSIASPLVAAEFAVIDHSSGERVGFVDPALYQIGNAQYNGTYSSRGPFYFVHNGSNHDFPALNGYNLVTGWGSVNAYNFMMDYLQMGKAALNFTESGLPTGTEWYVNVSGRNLSTSGTYISEILPYGNYSYNVGNALSYHEFPSSGKMDLSSPYYNLTGYFSSKKYNVSFEEVGLTIGTPWYVSFNGSQNTSTGSIINFTSYIGEYNFTIPALNQFIPSMGNGYITILNSSVSISIIFERIYNVTFVSTGLKNGTFWGISLSGSTAYTNHNELIVKLTNGTYKFYVSGLDGYVSNITNGTVTISGSAASVFLTWYPAYNVTFVSIGLGSGTTWGIHLLNSTIYSRNASIITEERNGSYTFYPIGSSSYYPLKSPGNFSIAGSAVSINVYFKDPSEYDVNFYEQGLPSGLKWSVYVNGTKFSSSDSVITDIVPNGTYSYIVGILSGFKSSTAGGTINVMGRNVSINVTFRAVVTGVNFVLLNYGASIPWHVEINGSVEGDFNANSSNLTIPLPSGSYTYMLILGNGNSTPVSSGSFVISGSSVTIYVNLTYSTTQQTIDLIYGISIFSVGLVFIGIGIISSRRKK